VGVSFNWSMNNISYALQADSLMMGVTMMHHLVSKFNRNQCLKLHNSEKDLIHTGFGQFGQVYDDGTGLVYSANPGKVDI
jgi:hypothetical protein